jgi:hypothetical protein
LVMISERMVGLSDQSTGEGRAHSRRSYLQPGLASAIQRGLIVERFGDYLWL